MDPRIAPEHEKYGQLVHVGNYPMLALIFVSDKHVQDRDVHFLKIEVEGPNEKVMRVVDWANRGPWIVAIEAIPPITRVAASASLEPIPGTQVMASSTRMG